MHWNSSKKITIFFNDWPNTISLTPKNKCNFPLHIDIIPIFSINRVFYPYYPKSIFL